MSTIRRRRASTSRSTWPPASWRARQSARRSFSSATSCPSRRTRFTSPSRSPWPISSRVAGSSVALSGVSAWRPGGRTRTPSTTVSGSRNAMTSSSSAGPPQVRSAGRASTTISGMSTRGACRFRSPTRPSGCLARQVQKPPSGPAGWAIRTCRSSCPSRWRGSSLTTIAKGRPRWVAR